MPMPIIGSFTLAVVMCRLSVCSSVKSVFFWNG